MGLAELKKQRGDTVKVSAWLDSIGETDKACRDEVLANCMADKEACAYYVGRYDSECNSGAA